MRFDAIYKGTQHIHNVYKGTRVIFQTNRIDGGYTTLSYIESDGTMWIDTGIIPNGGNTAIEIKFTRMANDNVKDCIYGVMDDTNAFAYYVKFDSKAASHFKYGTIERTAVPDVNNTINQYNTVLVANQTRGVYTVNTIQVASYTTQAFTINKPLYLLKCNGDEESYSRIRLHKCKIWDGDVLVRDYVPCTDINGEYCLFDLVTSSPTYFSRS